MYLLGCLSNANTMANEKVQGEVQGEEPACAIVLYVTLTSRTQLTKAIQRWKRTVSICKKSNLRFYMYDKTVLCYRPIILRWCFIYNL